MAFLLLVELFLHPAFHELLAAFETSVSCASRLLVTLIQNKLRYFSRMVDLLYRTVHTIPGTNIRGVILLLPCRILYFLCEFYSCLLLTF